MTWPQLYVIVMMSSQHIVGCVGGRQGEERESKCGCGMWLGVVWCGVWCVYRQAKSGAVATRACSCVEFLFGRNRRLRWWAGSGQRVAGSGGLRVVGCGELRWVVGWASSGGGNTVRDEVGSGIYIRIYNIHVHICISGKSNELGGLSYHHFIIT